MFMETLMGCDILKGSRNRSEDEMRQYAYESGEVLIPFLTKKFPNPDQALAAIISILAQIALLEPDKMKRLVLLNNVQSAVLGMVDLYEKGELDESQEESSGEEVEIEDVSTDPDQDDEEEGDEEDGEEGDEEYSDDGEVRAPKVPEMVDEEDDALELAGYHPPEEEEEEGNEEE